MDGLQANLGKMQRLQEQLSSGKQVSRPSDGPVQTAEAMQYRSQLRRGEQLVRNADDGLAWLGTADSVLTSSLDMTRRVRELVLTGMNDTIGRESRLALAEEVDNLRAGLLDVANTVYLDRPVFGGTTGSARAFAPDGQFLGDDGVISRTVAPGTQVQVNMNGEDVFGEYVPDDGDPMTPDGTQLFQVLSRIAAALRDPDSTAMHDGLDKGLQDLDVAVDRVVTGLGQVGARYNRIETMRAQASDDLISLRTSLSEVEDIDLPKTIVDLQMQEVAYKAALGATARVVQPSLLDFLR